MTGSVTVRESVNLRIFAGKVRITCLLYTSPSPRDRIGSISYAVFCLKKKKIKNKKEKKKE